jgi:uncharacterized membrane protein
MPAADQALAERLDRQGIAARRAAAGTLAGCAALGVSVAAGAAWWVAVLVAWDAAAASYLVSVWAPLGRLDPGRTERVAASEDDSRTASEALLLGASIASLVAVGFTLARAGHAAPGARGALTALSVVSVLFSWASVHTVYALRYARLYYTSPVGGLGFGGGGRPGYGDFAYVAVTIGMTYQVSDTDISKRPIRRAAIHHALLSYLFGTVILGIAVSSTAAILNG